MANNVIYLEIYLINIIINHIKNNTRTYSSFFTIYPKKTADLEHRKLKREVVKTHVLSQNQTPFVWKSVFVSLENGPNLVKMMKVGNV